MTDTKPSMIFVTRKFPPAIGGMETYSARLCDGLKDSYDVTLLACAGRENGAPPSEKTLLTFGWRAFWTILRTQQAPRVLHVGDMATWPLALPAKLKRWPTRIILSAHGTDVSYPLRGGLKGRLYGAYLRLGRRLLSGACVVANSGATAAATRDLGWSDVAVVPLASDLRGTDTAPTPTRSLLFAGRILPLKGLSWFVEHVLPQLPDDITLQVAGTIWDDKEAQCLKHPKVDYLGPVPQTKLIEYYANALAVIIPNIPLQNRTFEGFGLVATEASACGAVTLASASGGLSDAVIEGTTGFLLPPQQAPAWTHKINDIASWSPETRADFVSRSMQTCIAYYNWERVVEETVATYDV
ncbi:MULTISPECIES: glycosyltransferase family 4 protein [Pacificibacter]|uniref:glycosyltransferase family 4 protein n=1 Tax=Pacificibacter TaxID=1042323 RepID=UPI001C09FF44|nr:glycosyltransferase family 4 protein [Pacificibacter sp. 1_MG-2023]MBU2936754.1 glycosyltransferase family 4 protein [Pacificibacter marinus]MDO6614747.1 glycosyltransferase family 4 protein [Pacificibacter sp. 1_MG-2023]